MWSKPSTAAAAVALILLVLAPIASARSDANVAALQVALRALHHYSGAVDGIRRPGTKAATPPPPAARGPGPPLGPSSAAATSRPTELRVPGRAAHSDRAGPRRSAPV